MLRTLSAHLATDADLGNLGSCCCLSSVGDGESGCGQPNGVSQIKTHHKVHLELSTFPRGSKYPIMLYMGFGVVVLIAQVLGKYVIIGHLDP